MVGMVGTKEGFTIKLKEYMLQHDSFALVILFSFLHSTVFSLQVDDDVRLRVTFFRVEKSGIVPQRIHAPFLVTFFEKIFQELVERVFLWVSSN